MFSLYSCEFPQSSTLTMVKSLLWVPRSATVKLSPYHQEIMSSHLDNATAICCWESREQKGPSSIGGRDGILSLCQLEL